MNRGELQRGILLVNLKRERYPHLYAWIEHEQNRPEDGPQRPTPELVREWKTYATAVAEMLAYVQGRLPIVESALKSGRLATFSSLVVDEV